MIDVEKYLNQAIALAQKSPKKTEILNVAHPDDPLVYKLGEIRGDTAILLLPAKYSPTGEDIIKEFPLAEIFDVDLVDEIAQTLRVKDIFGNGTLMGAMIN